MYYFLLLRSEKILIEVLRRTESNNKRENEKGLNMKRKLFALLGISILSLAAGCGKSEASTELCVIDDDYRTTYEIFVYSFYDSDGDGIGDLQGVIEKLDYINDGDDTTDTDLGCNQIWLMPICPSTTYHKYDVTDYCDVDPEYGTVDDYKMLIEEAHKRGIRVINDTVMNHSSSKHPWFLEAAEYLKNLPEGAEPDPAECKYVDYYNFTKDKQEGYTQLAGTEWYYESRFWSEMPDLNLDNEEVRNEFKNIAKFWLDLGCDGFRMDAVTSYYTDDTVKSVGALKNFQEDVSAIDPDAYIVAEAWDSSATYSKYYESGIDSLFDFDFADSEGIVAKCARTKLSPEKYVTAQIKEDELYSGYNEEYVNAPFYTNHDMARSAGYYTGSGSEDRVKLSGALNLLMTGNAFIYYGEELGMKGSGKDENKRAPMQWDAEGTDGMTKGPADMDKVEMKYGTLKEQSEDENSIYSYYKKAISLRNIYPSIARGDVRLLDGLTGDNTAVWIKEIDEDKFTDIPEGKESVMIALNNSEEEITIDLSVDEESADYRTLGTSLTTGEEDASLDGDTLTLPAFGIAIITK